MGLASGHLSEIVNGKRLYLAPKTRQKLLDALGLPFEELFEIERERKAVNRKRPMRPTIPEGKGDSPMLKILPDLRFAVRSLAKRPTFTAAAVITLAVGIAANTTLFSFVNSVLVRPFPYSNPEELVIAYTTDESRGRVGNLSYPDYKDYREAIEQTGLIDIAVHDWEPYAIAGDGGAARVGGGRVSANLFDVLGIQPLLGRTFLPEEEEPGATPVVILSEQLWRRQFGADEGVLGRTVLLNGRPHVVIGIIPRDGAYPERARLWVTLANYPARDSRASRGLQATARLRPATSVEAAQATLEPIAARLREQYPDSNGGRGVQLVTLREALVGDMRVLSLTLLVFVSFILLIVCANVANLLLAHGVSREREMAVRAALGASRAQLVRQLLTESLLLSIVGCGVGFVLGYLGIQQLPRLIPIEIPAWVHIGVDGNVVLYTIGLSALSAVLFGLAPAFSTARTEVSASLREGARGLVSSLRGQRLRAALVVSEVALSVVLLVGAGLIIQSLMRLSAVDPGFESDGRLTVGIDLLAHADSEPSQRVQVFNRLLERLEAVPGVRSVAAIDRMPLKGASNRVSYTVEGQSVEEQKKNTSALYNRIGGDYFRAMGIRMREGAPFDRGLSAVDPRVAIVNESFADRHWPGEDAVGKRFKLYGPDSDQPWMLVKAVVGDVRHFGLDEGVTPALYVPFQQSTTLRLTWVFHTDTDPAGLTGAVRAAVRDVDPNQPVHEVMTLGTLVDQSYWEWRFFGTLFWMFAGLALLLAIIGIYSVMSYTVSERTHEVGLRMALGARKSEVMALVLKQGFARVLLGLALGLPLAVLLGRVLSGVLFDVAAFEAATFVGVAVLLSLVSLAAMAIPARRAANVDPLVSLRYE